MLHLWGTLDRALTVLQTELHNGSLNVTRQWVENVRKWLDGMGNSATISRAEGVVFEELMNNVSDLLGSNFKIGLKTAYLQRGEPIPLDTLKEPFKGLELELEEKEDDNGTLVWAFSDEKYYVLGSFKADGKVWLQVCLIQNSMPNCNAFKYITDNMDQKVSSYVVLFLVRALSEIMQPENVNDEFRVISNNTIFSGVDGEKHWDELIKYHDSAAKRIDPNILPESVYKSGSHTVPKDYLWIYSLPTTKRLLWMGWSGPTYQNAIMWTSGNHAING